jgi:5-methylcytosine-specific restriction endonuclease McrA
MTPVLPTSEHYLQNLIAMKSSDAHRLWRKAIKEANNYECIYCGERHYEHNLTIDHVRPRTMGGANTTSNCVPACKSCNQSKGSMNWVDWFRDNFPPDPFRENLILTWIQ